MQSKIFGHSLFEVGASSKAFKSHGNKLSEIGIVDEVCKNPLWNLSKDRGKKSKSVIGDHRAPNLLPQVQRKKKLHPPLVLKRRQVRKKISEGPFLLERRKKKDSLVLLNSNQLDPTISNSIDDSHVRSVNRLHLKDGNHVAGRIWEIDQKIGVTFSRDDAEKVNRIEELEARDRIGSPLSNRRDIQCDQ